MKVRVRSDAKVLTVTAFGGLQLTRSEWREVPSGSEVEARKHPYLEVEPDVPPEEIGTQKPTPPEAPAEKPAKKPPKPKGEAKTVSTETVEPKGKDQSVSAETVEPKGDQP